MLDYVFFPFSFSFPFQLLSLSLLKVSFKQKKTPPPASVASNELGFKKSHLDVALGSEVVDLSGLNLADDVDEAGRVSEISIVEGHFGTALVLVVVEMLNPSSVEGAGATDDSVHIVALGKEKLSQVRTILTSDSSNQGHL